LDEVKFLSESVRNVVGWVKTERKRARETGLKRRR